MKSTGQLHVTKQKIFDQSFHHLSWDIQGWSYSSQEVHASRSKESWDTLVPPWYPMWVPIPLVTQRVKINDIHWAKNIISLFLIKVIYCFLKNNKKRSTPDIRGLTVCYTIINFVSQTVYGIWFFIEFGPKYLLIVFEDSFTIFHMGISRHSQSGGLLPPLITLLPLIWTKWNFLWTYTPWEKS